MLFKRPHTLKYIKVVTTGSYQDENGDWHPGTTVKTDVIVKCKSEPNAENKIIKSVDGQDIIYDRVIYLDSNVEDIPYNTSVEVQLQGQTVASGTVKLFERYQKHSCIWI